MAEQIEQKYYTIVTDLGTELIAKAAQNGTKVNIIQIAAGDGNGESYKPTSDMTSLKREIWRGSIQNYEIDSIAKNVIKISGVIPKEVGHFVLREIALFDDKNNMIAICNAPDLLKAVLEEGALTEAVVYMSIAVTNTQAVTIQVNGSAIYATLQELEAHKIDEAAHQALFDKKVDKTDMENALKNKADKVETENALKNKADKIETENALNTKVDKTDFTGANIGNLLEAAGWESNSDMTAQEILEALKTVDGNGSGLDAELLRGKEATGHHNYGAANIAIGSYALNEGVKTGHSGNDNIAIGVFALNELTLGDSNTAIGFSALKDLTNHSNCTGLGANSTVTGSDQVQLGDSSTTVYAQKAVQTRSDARDKIDIQDTTLGLEFIKKLTPRQFRMNSRELYFKDGEKRDYSTVKGIDKAGKRFHQGFVAQEVKEVLEELDVDFAGYQDHKINGGEDVLSLGYTEFIAPIVKAIQQQQEMIETQQQKIAWLEQQIKGGK